MKNAIILDLDETLIKSYSYSDETLQNVRDLNLNYKIIDVTLMKKRSVEYERFITVSRPHLKEFLLFCRSHFDYVCVWTAGIKEYANEIVNNFFIYDPHIVWHRKYIDVNSEGNRYKSIPKIRDAISDIRGDRINTFMVDDLPINCIDSDGFHVIKKYEPLKDHVDFELQTLISTVRKQH